MSPDRRFDIALPVPDSCSGKFLFGGERYLPEGVANERGKGLWSGSHLPFLLNEFEPTGWHPHWTQIDLSLGLVATLKVGFNPGELLDFILGWTTLDIFSDDLEARYKKHEESNQRMETDG